MCFTHLLFLGWGKQYVSRLMEAILWKEKKKKEGSKISVTFVLCQYYWCLLNVSTFNGTSWLYWAQNPLQNFTWTSQQIFVKLSSIQTTLQFKVGHQNEYAWCRQHLLVRGKQHWNLGQCESEGSSELSTCVGNLAGGDFRWPFSAMTGCEYDWLPLAVWSVHVYFWTWDMM